VVLWRLKDMHALIPFLKRNKAAAVLMLFGILFILLGIFRGEAAAVLNKAVNICMECIGLG
jgi:hypothetical protein